MILPICVICLYCQMHRFSVFWHMRLPHRLQGQKSKSRGGGILWRRPSRTACYFLFQVAVSPRPPSRCSPHLSGRWQTDCNRKVKLLLSEVQKCHFSAVPPGPSFTKSGMAAKRIYLSKKKNVYLGLIVSLPNADESLSIANRSRVSCAHNSSRASIITPLVEIQVKGHSRSLKMVPFESLDTVSYSLLQ